MPDERGRPMGERARPSPERRGTALTRIRLPLWLTLALVLGVSVLILFLAAGRSKVDLGPSIKGAQDVQVCVLAPDARPSFDVSRAEKTIEDALKGLGAQKATTRIERPPSACASVLSPPTTAAPTTTTTTPSPSPTPSR